MMDRGHYANERVAYITRVQSFSACHRLHSQSLSDDDKRIFGKCNNPNGHGHNYKVEVTLRGKINQITGMVMNFADMQLHIEETVMKSLDHKNLDLDVAYFANNVSTSENLAVWIWDSMATRLPPCMLYEVKVYETERSAAMYRGE